MRYSYLKKNDPHNEILGEINLTPLIDVVFVILVTFILIAPFVDIENIQLAQSGPQAKEVNQLTKNGISIHLKKNNSIWLNNRELTLLQLEKILIILKANHPESTIQVIPDKHAYFGTFQMIKSSIEKAGFEEMDIILSKQHTT